ncbi:hypothetical protein D9Q98_002231 [Chlorella vulgaris]|uniref:Copper transport protein n=1 Tax=Chlorella vulgaris TaxID=3077 RepID=A0A9D4TWA4_CHLVU|nr:hypothetical protein D9Q98_002231 [Chlorella vulgaris]
MVICSSHTAWAVLDGLSANMSDPCYTDPSAPDCATFERSAADWTDDLELLCQQMPFMVGCSMWKQCTGGQADADSPYCSLASLVADICVADQMNSMNGCEAHNALCGDGTVVQQCLDPGAAPNVPTTFLTKANIDGVCTSHAMDGCQDCTSVGRTNFKSCPELFNTYSKLCVSMPEMPQCQEWALFCSNSSLADFFPQFCTGDAADGSITALPPMKMWMHQSTRDIFLFKEWVPTGTGQYIGMCIGMCVLAVFTQFLKAVRLRAEMRWSALSRVPGPCCTLPKPSPTLSDMSGIKPSASEQSELAEIKTCCGGGGASVAPEPELPVPRSRTSPWWRSSARRSEFTVCGVPVLLSGAQARRNFWRAVFTFVVIILDYSLMLVVMTFNIGVILAVCGGFAIGALLFGHAGERSDSGSEVRHVAASSSTTDELEAVFVEGPACCSGGSGCGGGGHSGGQL